MAQSGCITQSAAQRIAVISMPAPRRKALTPQPDVAAPLRWPAGGNEQHTIAKFFNDYYERLPRTIVFAQVIWRPALSFARSPAGWEIAGARREWCH